MSSGSTGVVKVDLLKSPIFQTTSVIVKPTSALPAISANTNIGYKITTNNGVTFGNYETSYYFSINKIANNYSQETSIEETIILNSDYVYKAVLEDSHRHDAIDDLLELLNGYH